MSNAKPVPEERIGGRSSIVIENGNRSVAMGIATCSSPSHYFSRPGEKRRRGRRRRLEDTLCRNWKRKVNAIDSKYGTKALCNMHRESHRSNVMYCGGEEKNSAAPGGRGACLGRCYIDRTISTGGEARNTVRWGSIVYLGFFFGVFLQT